MSKRRKPLKDLSRKHLKRIALKEAEIDLSFFSETESDLSVISTLSTQSDSEVEVENEYLALNVNSHDDSVKETTLSSPCPPSCSLTNCTSSTSAPCSSSSTTFVSSSEPFEVNPNFDEQHGIESVTHGIYEERTLNSDLANWAVTNGISLQALSQLLKLLNNHGHKDLPLDARAFLKTPRSTVVREVSPGLYWHAGIRHNIVQDAIKNSILKIKDLDLIELAIGVDGLPIAKSSGSGLWPILGKIINTPEKHIFTIGVYHGSEKPNDANDFLADFIEEMIELSINGLYLGTKFYKISIKYLICDAPAKSFILKVRGHTGYGSCTKCKIKGQYINRSVCFCKTSNEHVNSRSDSDFFEIPDKKFHIGSSDLKKIPNFGLVTNVPLDYMHLVCLGVMKKLMYLWIFGDRRVKKRNQLFKINNSNIDLISRWLESITAYVPNEFSRKPRSVKEVKMWKATEFRQLLLYTGIVVLQHALPAVIYEHFVCLHIAVKILCCPNLSGIYFEYAGELLQNFVTSFAIIYGKHNVSHNIHGLLHLSDDVDKFGTLDEFSAFAFENEMQLIKKKLRKSEKPLQQLSRRYFEEKNNKLLDQIPKREIEPTSLHHTGPLIANTRNPQYKVCYIRKDRITSNSKADSCCQLIDGTIVFIHNIAHSLIDNELVIIGQELQESGEELFQKPCKSSVLNIKIVSEPLQDLKQWPLSAIKQKLFLLPMINSDKKVVMPILHHN